MSCRLLLTPRAIGQLRRAPADLTSCIRFFLGELEQNPTGWGRRVGPPFPEVLGFYFECRSQDGTLYHLSLIHI